MISPSNKYSYFLYCSKHSNSRLQLRDHLRVHPFKPWSKSVFYWNVITKTFVWLFSFRGQHWILMLFWGVRCPLNMVHVWLWFDYIYFPHINLSHVGNCDSDTFLEMSQKKNVPTNHSVDPTKMKRIFWKAWLVKTFSFVWELLCQSVTSAAQRGTFRELSLNVHF